jgi:hypothetical protein
MVNGAAFIMFMSAITLTNFIPKAGQSYECDGRSPLIVVTRHIALFAAAVAKSHISALSGTSKGHPVRVSVSREPVYL